MSTLLSSISIGFHNFPIFVIVFTLPILGIQLLRYKRLNFMRISLNYCLLLYGLCLFALVFLPLPDPEVAATLHTHYIQLIPFHFISDIIKESPLNIADPHTYLPAIFADAVLQYIFNIVMAIPFGMFLTYYFGCSRKKVIFYTFLLTCLIEFGQLTGLFFLYKGSYRFCDVDDLIANTLGGYLGYRIAGVVERYLPAIKSFDLPLAIPSRHTNKESRA